MRNVYGGGVISANLYISSDITVSEKKLGVRPVVSLSPKVKLINTNKQKNGCDVYNIIADDMLEEIVDTDMSEE